MAGSFPELDGHDAYDLLGVPEDASDAEIRAAHRALVRDHHPDLRGDSGAAGTTARLNAARDILLKRRRAYDDHRTAAAGPDEPEEIIDDPWDSASPGTGSDDPWSTASPGPAPPPHAPPPYAPPPPEPDLFEEAPREFFPPPAHAPPHYRPVATRTRHRPTWPMIGCGCASVLMLTAAILLWAFVTYVVNRDTGGPYEEKVAVPPAFTGQWKMKGGEDSKGTRRRLELDIRPGRQVSVVRNLCFEVLRPSTRNGDSLILTGDGLVPDCADAAIRLTLRRDDRLDIAYCKDDACAKVQWKGVLTRA
ncbi:J domain-containing protein [Actinocorallia longicatena]|uniref:J domain-containing protein n=1 Tax=Actinocorallia longicatena TaxID=111803 RepID=A0ABP6PZF1_9ACTN